MAYDDRKRFLIQITSIDEFAALVAILRGDDVSTIPALIDQLKASSTALQQAEDTVPPITPTT